jgi:phosphate transport system substrate-binding protein
MHNKSRRSFTALLIGGAILAASPVLAQTSYYIPSGTAMTQVAAVQPQSENVIVGSGSTFAAPLYKNWSEAYFKSHPGSLEYNGKGHGTGSGAGVAEFSSGVTQFGGSDVPMSDEQVQNVRGNNKDVLHIPAAYGGIVVTYNLPGIKGTLNLTGDQLSGIYLGQIRKWNDARLVKTNPQLAAVNQDIITFHRGDASGTTYAFTSYLDDSSSDFRATIGSGFAVYWNVGETAFNNKAVVDAVRDNPYSIGYADYNFVVDEKMPMASLANKSGSFIAPNAQSIGAAVASAADGADNDLRLRLVNTSGAGSYPLVSATYIIVHQHQGSAFKAQNLKSFLQWAMNDGQKMEAALNYVPLPANVVEKASRLINSIDGNPGK